MPKRIVSFFLFFFMVISLISCNQHQASSRLQPEKEQILDGAGRLIDLPHNKEEVTIASVYAVSVPFIEALNLGEQVLAVNLKSNFWKEADPALAKAGTIGRGVVDLEALASYNPGVLIHRSNDNETVEAVERLEIPVLCITVENMADISETLTMMGAYFGREDRAKEVIDWMETKFSVIDEIVSKIPEEDRKTALVLGSEKGRVAASDMLQAWMVEKAGGIYVTQDTEENRNWVNVGVEQVFAWDPEVIFATSSTPLDYSLEDLLEQPTWNAVRAVSSGQVYQIPAKRDSWDIPGVSSVLGTFFMLHKMYPEHYGVDSLNEEISNYYQFMFGKTFDSDALGYDLGQE